jgi:FecR-like protein
MTTRTQELRTSAPPPRRRRPWLIALVLVLVLIAGLLVTAVVARQGDEALAELRVRDTDVQVAAKGAGLAKGAEGQSLTVGDVVQTDNSGQAQVDYFDGSLTRLDVNTRFLIRELSNGPSGRKISLDVKAGRTWNRVVRLSSTSDRYEVHMANAVAVVRGTTFIVDCRVQPCAIGAVEDTTHVVSEDGSEVDASDGDCYVLTEDGGIEPCDKATRKRVMGGSWVKMNKAEDELIGLPPVETESPSPSPTEEAPAFVPRRAPAPTPTPRRTLPPLPTDDPNATPNPSETPFGSTPEPPPPTPPATPPSTPCSSACT